LKQQTNQTDSLLVLDVSPFPIGVCGRVSLLSLTRGRFALIYFIFFFKKRANLSGSGDNQKPEL
jgi:hypothetical protein